jgi:mannose-6-phosphate isomerase-like protein (cupin superfamily)
MSFYNFKLNDPSAGVTSSSPDSKASGKFVHKTFEDFRTKGQSVNIAPKKVSVSRTVMTNDGRGKFTVSGWKEQGVIAPGGEKSRFRLRKTVTEEDVQQESLTTSNAPEVIVQPPHVDVVDIPDEISAVSINTSLQGITHTYSPLNLATLNSFGSPTSLRLVKLSGQSSWHSHDHTDEIFILLRGGINMLYRTRTREEKVTRVIGGELLRIPMTMEHCIVADEGTEVLLLEGKEGVCYFMTS